MQPQPGPPSFPWVWYIALVVSAGASGVAFGIWTPAGFVLGGVTIAVFVSFMVWGFRRAQRQRASGYRPDFKAVRERVRILAILLTFLTAATVVTSILALVTNDDDHPPDWLLLLGPGLMLFGLIGTWLMVLVLLPHMQRKQEAETDQGA